jgi:hypothetical protein
MRWTGWFRLDERSPWQRAAEADDLHECARRLSTATRGLNLRNTDEAITGGASPVLPDRAASLSAARTSKPST